MAGTAPLINFTFTGKRPHPSVPKNWALPVGFDLLPNDAIKLPGSEKLWIILGRIFEVSSDDSTTVNLTVAEMQSAATQSSD